MPRSRYTNQPDQPIVYSRSHGEPTENNFQTEEVIEIDSKGRNFNSTRNQTSYGNNQQARLIELYTGNGGVSEVGQVDNQANARYTNPDGTGSQYQEVGNVRARVVSVTPPPATALPTETINRRRIVVSKPVTTVQEIVEADNSTNNKPNGDYRENYTNVNRNNPEHRKGNDGRYQSNFESNNFNSDDGSKYNANYRNENNYNQNSDSEFRGSYQNDDENVGYYQDAINSNSNSGGQTKANYENKTPSSTGVYISTTPSTASQRIIYVQPVSQDFAQQRAIPTKQLKN